MNYLIKRLYDNSNYEYLHCAGYWTLCSENAIRYSKQEALTKLGELLHTQGIIAKLERVPFPILCGTVFILNNFTDTTTLVVESNCDNWYDESIDDLCKFSEIQIRKFNCDVGASTVEVIKTIDLIEKIKNNDLIIIYDVVYGRVKDNQKYLESIGVI